MDYTIAKKLKDAGFPQKPDGPFVFPADHNPRTLKGKRENEEVRVFVPTLSDLLQAWGTQAVTLRRDDTGRWHTTCANRAASHASLEQAVALLWLALTHARN